MIFFLNKKEIAWDWKQLRGEHSPVMHEALSSFPSTTEVRTEKSLATGTPRAVFNTHQGRTIFRSLILLM